MTRPALPSVSDMTIAFIGFGEAAMAFVQGWADDGPSLIKAYDIKTDVAGDVRDSKLADYEKTGVRGCDSAGEAAAGAEIVFSMVTADQALAAANSVTASIEAGNFFFDCNSCAPDTKRAAQKAIDGVGGRYVDVAVMAPVHPPLHRTPVLVSGPAAEDALEMMALLEMSAKHVPGDVGHASSIKMVRSVMMKGLEALVAECVLAGQKAGVADVVLDSLEKTYPGFGWKKRAGYMLERMMVHGKRRAAEMREVALTVDQLGLQGRMARATVDWQQQVGDMGLPVQSEDYPVLANDLLNAIENGSAR